MSECPYCGEPELEVVPVTAVVHMVEMGPEGSRTKQVEMPTEIWRCNKCGETGGVRGF